MVTGIFCLILSSGCAGKNRGFMSQTSDATTNFSQTWEATTNLTFGGQTSDATTDSTCDSDKSEMFLRNKPLNAFVAQNMDNLVVEIASGGGESLNTLAEIIDIPSEDHRIFFDELQENFDRVYPSADITHTEFIRNIARIVEQMPSRDK